MSASVLTQHMLASQTRTKIRNGDHEQLRVERRGIETEVPVECGSVFRKSMNEQPAEPDCVRGSDNTARRILKQGPAKTRSAMCLSNCQARE
jgi:hypothetical protein